MMFTYVTVFVCIFVCFGFFVAEVLLFPFDPWLGRGGCRLVKKLPSLEKKKKKAA